MLIDFSLARALHIFWKGRVRDFLDGKGRLTVDQATSHRECDLGKWMISTGMPRYGHMPEMQDLDRVHEELHATVRRIVELRFAGDLAGAEREYQTLDRLSSIIVNLLTRLDTKVKTHAA